MSGPVLPSRLLVVADAGEGPDAAPELIARAASAGARFFELRRKLPLGTADRVAEARACLVAAPAATLLVNDRLDVALASGAHGAHVGQDDLPPEAARRLLGPGRLLGLSTHDEAQFAASASAPLDYVALGPIFASPTKSGHAEPVGLEALRRCCERSRRPVVAIGGLDAEGARLALAAGAGAVAVVSAVARGRVEDNVAALLEACGEPPPPPAREEPPWVLLGLPGAGKSTVGRLLAERAGRSFEDLDERIEREAGCSIARIFDREGEEGFRRREERALLAALVESRGGVLALGGGALESEANRRALGRSGARGCRLVLPPEACARRLAGEGGAARPLLAGAPDEGELAERLRGLAARREDLFAAAAACRVDAEEAPAAVAEKALHALRAGEA